MGTLGVLFEPNPALREQMGKEVVHWVAGSLWRGKPDFVIKLESERILRLAWGGFVQVLNQEFEKARRPSSGRDGWVH